LLIEKLIFFYHTLELDAENQLHRSRRLRGISNTQKSRPGAERASERQMAQHRVLTIMPTEGTTKLIETERRFVFGKEVPCIGAALRSYSKRLPWNSVVLVWGGQAKHSSRGVAVPRRIGVENRLSANQCGMLDIPNTLLKHCVSSSISGNKYFFL